MIIIINRYPSGSASASHLVPHVVHAQLVGVQAHGGLQVVHVNQPQVLLPQLPAASLLHLQTEHRGHQVVMHMDFGLF